MRQREGRLEHCELNRTQKTTELPVSPSCAVTARLTLVAGAVLVCMAD